MFATKKHKQKLFEDWGEMAGGEGGSSFGGQLRLLVEAEEDDEENALGLFFSYGFVVCDLRSLFLTTQLIIVTL